MKRSVEQFNEGREFLINGRSMYKEFGVVCSKVSAGRAKPKSIKANVVGADGVIDLTESVSGGVTYEPREFSATFSTDCDTYWDAVKVADRIAAAFHGVVCIIKAPEFGGGYMVGRVEVGEPTLFQHAMTVTIEAQCDPYVYRAEAGRKQLPSAPGNKSAGGRIDGLPEEFSFGSFKALLTVKGGGGGWNDVSSTGALFTAATDNLLDIGFGAVMLSTREKAGGSWARSGNMRRVDQRVYTRAMSAGWVHRVSVLASRSKVWASEQGGFKRPSFPLCSGEMHLTAFVTGIAKSGSSPSIQLNAASGSGKINDESGGGKASSESSIYEKLVPQFGKSYVDEPISLRIPEGFGLNEFWIDFDGIESEGMGVSFMLSKGKPTAWVRPDVKSSTFSFGAVMQRSEGSADKADVSPFGTSTTKNTVQASDPRIAKDATPSVFAGGRCQMHDHRARSVMFMLLGTDGYIDYFDTELTTYPIQTQTVQNDAMPTTPSVTCSSPTIFVQDDRKIATGPGNTQLIPITIGRDSTQVRYSIVGNSSAELTWKKGYL